jgi:hypothetical protein
MKPKAEALGYLIVRRERKSKNKNMSLISFGKASLVLFSHELRATRYELRAKGYELGANGWGREAGGVVADDLPAGGGVFEDEEEVAVGVATAGGGAL